ncbi:hypothetical protein NDU88_007818 [Pleurodeles waltl]|uniref:Uncharacterized protein n=1 Tax=Pleurodeles waltl TaxID=8319 RepID=A0AAV7N558_PLEWA|nr:hypothetical protein NDU88_007818 [Pleurodeles waltl]
MTLDGNRLLIRKKFGQGFQVVQRNAMHRMYQEVSLQLKTNGSSLKKPENRIHAIKEGDRRNEERKLEKPANHLYTAV